VGLGLSRSLSNPPSSPTHRPHDPPLADPTTPIMDMDDAKGQHQQHAPGAFGQDTPPRSDIDDILRRKRKAREYKVRCIRGKSRRLRPSRRCWNLADLFDYKGLLSVSTAQSKMRSVCTMQDLRRSRTPRTLFIPSAHRSAPARETYKHERRTKWERLLEWHGAHTWGDSNIAARGVHIR
jgi:hypothetical protein